MIQDETDNFFDVKVVDIQPLAVDRLKAAQLIDCSVRTVQDLTKAGKLRSVKIGRVHRYPIEELQRFLREGIKNGQPDNGASHPADRDVDVPSRSDEGTH